MTEREQVLEILRNRGVLDGITWAHGSAYRQVRQDYNPAGGHNQAWIGYSAHIYLLDRLDRVFQCGGFAVPPGEDSVGRDVLADGITDRDFQSRPLLPPGTVLRRDLNGSPGWVTCGWRWLLASYEFGQVTKIRWSERSETKQLVAQQPHGEADGGLFPLFTLPGLPSWEGLSDDDRALRRTLVLAHAMDPITAEFELFLGRIRWNIDGGEAWTWRIDLTAQPSSTVDHSVHHRPIDPVISGGSDIEDAEVRVRRPARDQDGAHVNGVT
jgi:hypothetical protein